MSSCPRLLICAFHCLQFVTIAILYVCCMQNPLAFLFLSPSAMAQLSLNCSKASTVIMRCSVIREIPTFLDYRITMRANPNWICILNEAAPSFQMLVETANVYVIIRLLSSCSDTSQDWKSGGWFSARTEKVSWTLLVTVIRGMQIP